MMTDIARRRVQRGFNLVEVGIVLAVIGLLLGASIVPLGQLWKNETYNEEESVLQMHQDSILGYALTHTTEETEVIVENAGGLQRVYKIPAGRPYLPCPDVTGDGYEDRIGMVAALVFRPADSYTITPTENPLLAQGNCLLSRGILPWNTLGVPAADAWGNRYTYQVDDVFSNAVIGFNQDTVADSFDYRRTVQISVGLALYQKRLHSLVVTVDISGTNFDFVNRRRPIVVCSINVELCHPSSTVKPLELVGGNIASAGFSGARRVYAADDVVEGVVYAIVSHGVNGHGAVSHQANRGRRLRCNAPIYSASMGAAAQEVAAHLRHEAVNFPFAEQGQPDAHRYCPAVKVTSPAAASLQNGYFVAGARGLLTGADALEYDDIVVWAVRREVFQPLTRAQKLPANALPLFRPY